MNTCKYLIYHFKAKDIKVKPQIEHGYTIQVGCCVESHIYLSTSCTPHLIMFISPKDIVDFVKLIKEQFLPCFEYKVDGSQMTVFLH